MTAPDGITVMRPSAPDDDLKKSRLCGEWKPILTPCRHCARSAVVRRTWESHDGAYEDHQFRCTECGETWWVDGIDS